MQHRRTVSQESTSVSAVKRLIHKIQKKYPWVPAAALSVSCTLELVMLGTYVYAEQFRVSREEMTISTYNQGSDIFALQVALSIIFSLEWIFFLLADEYKRAYLLSTPTLVNCLTCFPMVICGIGALFSTNWTKAWIPLFLRVWWLYDHILLFVEYPQVNFVSELHREMIRNILSLLSAMITCVGLFHATESFTGGKPIHLFESTYFIVVTFGTIGYGDIFPTTPYSQLATLAIIVVAIYKFPLFFSNLANIAKQKPKFTTYDSKGGTKLHVIVAGNLEDRDVTFFLNEFFSGTRRFIQLHIVLLSAIEFSQEVRLIVSSPGYNQRVTLVIGDPSQRADLDRCDAAFADAIFLVSSSNNPFSDYEIVMRAMAVHQYDANLPLHVMLQRERSSKFVRPFAVSVMEKERLKLTMMGMAAVLPGVIPFIVNLIRTYDPDPRVRRCSTWKESMEWSMGNELYTVPIPEKFQGWRFLHLVSSLSFHFVTAIGVVLANGKVRLNPGNLFVAEGMKLIVIAPDTATVFSALSKAEKTLLSEHLTIFSSKDPKMKPVAPVEPQSTFRAVEQVKECRQLKGHFVLVDLSSAHLKPLLSSEGESEAEQFVARDLLNVIRPIKQRFPEKEIVLLSRSQLGEFFEKCWLREHAWRTPLITIDGCGLNMNDLKKCNVANASAIVVFSIGETADSNSDAMSMLVTLSIHELLAEKGNRGDTPVITQIGEIESLSLFPPYYTEDSMSTVAEDNFAFQPNFLIGNSICSAMLDPALYQTYFNPYLLNLVDAFVGPGGDATSTIRCMAVDEPQSTPYSVIVSKCVDLGIVPIGLHRVIQDEKNPGLTGRRFMFTNPPPTSLTDSTDIIYYLSSSR